MLYLSLLGVHYIIIMDSEGHEKFSLNQIKTKMSRIILRLSLKNNIKI